MPDSPKRLTTEEIWATGLAVIGGLAVLVPLIVIALNRPADAIGVGGEAEGLRKELAEARGQIAALSVELEATKGEVEASERSAQRAWIQLREAAGEIGDGGGLGEDVESEDSEGGNNPG